MEMLDPDASEQAVLPADTIPTLTGASMTSAGRTSMRTPAQRSSTDWALFNWLFDATHAEAEAIARMRGVPLLPDDELRRIVDQRLRTITLVPASLNGRSPAASIDCSGDGLSEQRMKARPISPGFDAGGTHSPETLAPNADDLAETNLIEGRSRGTEAAQVDPAMLQPAVWNPGEGAPLIRVLNPPKPPFTQSGSWSAPFMPASSGQSGDDTHGSDAIQAAYASGKGGTYVVDPQTMKMDHAMRGIGADIHQSLTTKGYMASVLHKALADPRRTAQFDSGSWTGKGYRALNDGLLTADGQSVGRFAGYVRGELKADPKTRTYTVTGTVVIKSDKYDWTPDGGSVAANFAIWAGGLVRGTKGKTINLDYNRYYNFTTHGSY